MGGQCSLYREHGQLGPYPATLSGPCRRTAKRSGGAPSNHRDPNPAKSSPAHAAEGTAKGDNPARHPVVAETVKGWRNQAPASKQASALTAEALARIRETAQFVKGTPLQELDHRRGVAILEREHTSPRPSDQILEVGTIKVPKPSSWQPESRSTLHESVLAKGKKEREPDSQ